MPRCTLNYYIIIIDFRDMGGGLSLVSLTQAWLAFASAQIENGN